MSLPTSTCRVCPHLDIDHRHPTEIPTTFTITYCNLCFCGQFEYRAGETPEGNQ